MRGAARRQPSVMRCANAELPLRTAAGRVDPPLQLDREQRVGTGGSGPGVGVQSEHQQVIELERGRFQHAHHLHRNRRGLWLEQALRCQPAHSLDRRPESDRAEDQVEVREAGQQLAPGLDASGTRRCRAYARRASRAAASSDCSRGPQALGNRRAACDSRARIRNSRSRSSKSGQASRRRSSRAKYSSRSMRMCGSPPLRMRASSSARGPRSDCAPPRKGDRSSTLAADVGRRSDASRSTSSAACATGHSDNGKPSERFQGRAIGAPGARTAGGTRTSSKARAMRARWREQIGDDDADRRIRFALENAASPLRGGADLFLRTGLRQHHRLTADSLWLKRFYARAGRPECFEQRSPLRIELIEPVDHQMRRGCKEPAPQYALQLVAQARAVEDGLARAKVRRRPRPSPGTHAPSSPTGKRRRSSASRYAQTLSQASLAVCASGPRCNTAAFVAGFADHPLPQGKLLLRGQQERERLAGTELGGLPQPLLPGGPWQNVGGGPGAPAGGLLLGVVGAPNGARQAPRGSDYGRAASQGGERRGVHLGIGALDAHHPVTLARRHPLLGRAPTLRRPTPLRGHPSSGRRG